MRPGGSVNRRLTWYAFAKGREYIHFLSWLIFRFTKRDARIVSGWDFDRLIPCHGEVVETGGKKMWNDQYAWYLEQDHKAWMFFVFRTGICLFNGCTWARCLVLLDCNYTIRVVYQKWWSQQCSHLSYQYPGEPRLCYRGSLFITSIPTWELTYRLDWLHGRDWTLVPSSRERRFIEMSKNRGLIARCSLK